MQFPEERAIWSYGSGYGGNALLGKKCYALRIASVMARDEGWLAEHMLILKLTSPEGVAKYIAAAFPSACGKTNLAMLEPTIPGWKVETLGDDIAWMRVGEDGRLWAVNPEYGFFGVAPGTNEHTNPNAMKTINKGNSVFTNVALTEDGDIWWEGLENTAGQGHVLEGRALDARLRGAAPATPTAATARRSSSATSSRPSTTTRAASRSTRSSSAAAARPPSRWSSRPATGPTAPSSAPRSPRETTAAAVGQVGVVRRDPMAMLPFIGYNAGDYFSHWINVGKENDAAKLPRIFYVNWFRRDDEGGFLWPGFGENSRVLKWVVERIDGQAAAVETPIGHVPAPGSLDIDGLDMTEEALAAALAVDAEEWKAEIPQIQEWFEKFGDAAAGRALDRARRPPGPPRRLTTARPARHGAAPAPPRGPGLGPLWDHATLRTGSGRRPREGCG